VRCLRGKTSDSHTAKTRKRGGRDGAGRICSILGTTDRQGDSGDHMVVISKEEEVCTGRRRAFDNWRSKQRASWEGRGCPINNHDIRRCGNNWGRSGDGWGWRWLGGAGGGNGTGLDWVQCGRVPTVPGIGTSTCLIPGHLLHSSVPDRDSL
jgi:hypothetical protein